MRTKKALKGTIYEIIPTIIIALLGLIKTKVFIEYLGSDMNGYYQFINQFISYLFLAEAGFTTAITYKLYKPIAKKDNEKISELYYGGLKIFHRIGLIISAGILILCFFFNFFIHDTNSIKLIVIISFILISLSNVISFFFYSKMYQALYAANQEVYKASMITNIFKIISEIALIIIPIFYPSLLLIALIMFICKVGEEIAFIFISRKKFTINKVPKDKYDTSAYKMTKDLIFSQIGYLAFNNIDMVIIMGFKSLGAIAVSIYSAYNYISRFIFSLIAKISSVSLHLLGNVFVKDEKENTKGIFNEYLSFSFILATICSLCFFIGARSFIKVWINDSNYLLNIYTVGAFSLILFLSITMEPLTGVISANGLFKESKYYTLTSSILNLTLSVILCKYYGIVGVLIATIISYLLDITFRSILVIQKVFPEIGYKKLFSKYIISFIVIITLIFISSIIENRFLNISTSYLSFFLGIIIIFIISSILVLLLYCLIYKSARALIKRGRRLLAR